MKRKIIRRIKRARIGVLRALFLWGFRGELGSERGLVLQLVALPQPAHDIGKDRTAVLRRVAAVSPRVVHAITGTGGLPLIGVGVGPLEGGEHLLVGEPPTAEGVVEIVGAVLEENGERLDRVSADERRI